MPRLQILALLAVFFLTTRHDRSPTRGADHRRHKFIPDPSRLALETVRLEIERRFLRRHGRTFLIAWGRIDHALLRLVPYPTDVADVEICELALDVLREQDPEGASFYERRCREHRHGTLNGGDRR